MTVDRPTEQRIELLASRLEYAVRMTPDNTQPKFVRDQWLLVARTIVEAYEEDRRYDAKRHSECYP